MQDVWADQRELLQRGIARCLEDLKSGNGQLVREQTEASDPGDYEVAALACLAAARAAGGAAEAALPGAVSIVLLSQMALVYTGLENSGGAASLSTAWGMPRSLNAGDAMFALAQASLIEAPNELRAEDRLQTTSILDHGARDLVEALFVADSDFAGVGQRALLPAAMALGGLLGGGDAATRERLAELGRSWAALPGEELSRVLASDPAVWLAT